MDKQLHVGQRQEARVRAALQCVWGERDESYGAGRPSRASGDFSQAWTYARGCACAALHGGGPRTYDSRW